MKLALILGLGLACALHKNMHPFKIRSADEFLG